jgi:ankyrin repeat protein
MYVTRKHKKYKRIRILNQIHVPIEHQEIDKIVVRKIKYMDDEGRTPLMIACIHGSLDDISKPFHESDMNCTDDDGWTALMYAAHYGHVEAVKFLLDKGVNIHLTTHSGLNASQLAYFNSHYEISQMIQN